MQLSQADILIIPGLGNSGEDHWQSRWQAKLPTARRVEQGDWHRPDIMAWAARVREEAGNATRPVVLVSHSLGAYAVAFAAASLTGTVRGAFIVAPPAERILADMCGPAIVEALPRAPFPFKTLVIASRDDHYGDYEEIARLAKAWGAELSDAGNSGHINTDSGHGPWPEGLMRFGGFMKSL